jgi:NADH:ubiquinone oxidoreductase subunit 4 (subunit M)
LPSSASFAVKMPPVHTWLPDAQHVQAPTVVLSAGCDPVENGGYGFSFSLFLMFSIGSEVIGPLVVATPTPLLRWCSDGEKKLIAYSSVAPGYVTMLGILQNQQVMMARFSRMTSHGFISGAPFAGAYDRCTPATSTLWRFW